MLRFNEIFANREANHIAKTFELHFVHDVIAMALHGPRFRLAKLSAIVDARHPVNTAHPGAPG
jgi:hypothetical protein